MERIVVSEENLARFGKALSASWDESTCWPLCWNPDNPQAGHCRVTSVVTQDHFGGDILFAHVLNGTHYWNRLPNDQEQDYTRDQFPNGTEIPQGEVRTRDEVMGARPMETSYPTLSERVRNRLSES